ncbi:MAG: WecB/TagA/CpsF family glycosyltransferase [Patescibacteria group bacterium]
MQSPSTFECFGLVIHGLDWGKVKERLDQAVGHNERLWIVTANPEILLEAKRNPTYWQTLRQADLRLVDGVGLKLVGWLLGASPSRLTGVDLCDNLLKEAETRGWLVAFLGGEDGEGDKAAWEKRKQYPKLRIITEAGGRVNPDGTGDEANDEAVQRLTMQAPDVLFVANGHPKQEAWIARNADALPSVKLVVGVGGTFNYWAGTSKRPPSMIRSLGLEWLWRLIHEPKRWKRIWNAVVVFPFVVMNDRLRKK